MNKIWCIFNVDAYEGGELRTFINLDTADAIDRISWSWDCLKNIFLHEFYTDEELWEIWEEWYEHEDRHNLYAYDSRSEYQVYSIEDNRLVEDFPTKEEIINRMKFIIKEWKQGN